MASVCAFFFGPRLGHAAQAVAQPVEDRVDGARSRQVLLAPALLRDQSAAHAGGAQARVGERALKLRIGLAVRVGQRADVALQLRAFGLAPFVAPRREVVHAGDAAGALARPNSTVSRFQPKRLLACCALPPSSATATLAMKALRRGPVSFLAASPNNALALGESSGWRGRRHLSQPTFLADGSLLMQEL